VDQNVRGLIGWGGIQEFFGPAKRDFMPQFTGNNQVTIARLSARSSQRSDPLMARYRRKAPKKLGNKMREVRLRLDMTQEQVADFLGTDSGAVSRYERGLREPSLLELLAFSRMSGVEWKFWCNDELNIRK
jgi:DNA-binding XRE family transcriptional regulator